MKWVLDTNVVSEGVRKNPSRNVTLWIAGQPPDDLTISAVTIAELLDGASSARDESDRSRLANWIEAEVKPSFRERTLPITIEILIAWIELSRGLRSAGVPRDPADLLIAATARTHRLGVVTRNVRHFADTGITVYNPWTNETHKMEAP